MANGIHEADELTLIGWQLGMMRGRHTAEEGNNPITLVQHHARRVIVDDSVCRSRAATGGAPTSAPA
jgi:hypothetical protein